MSRANLERPVFTRRPFGFYKLSGQVTMLARNCGRLRDKDLGLNIEAASESLREYLDKWLETSIKPRVRSRTYHDYAALLTRYIRDPLGAIKLADLRPIDIPSGFNLYSLRHTHATLLLANGENAKVASERLGHSTIVLTLDTYSHVLPDMQRGAADRIESLLFKTGT